MPRKLLRRFLPTPHRIRSERSLRLFGKLLLRRELWSLHRRSVAKATAVGLFVAFIPLPTQMLMAAAAAIVLGFNLPVAVVMVWVTNPLTIPVVFYGAYRLGAWLLHTPPHPVHFQVSFSWFAGQVGEIWLPLLLGSLVAGVAAGILGYFVVNLLWRLHVARSWRARRLRPTRPGARAQPEPRPRGEVDAKRRRTRPAAPAAGLPSGARPKVVDIKQARDSHRAGPGPARPVSPKSGRE